ncbi:MAG: CHAT domain-containing protein [Deltaproteobacteria bacterium]|nr:CHAT domain-containing protein [Deltaproteobacteria bacterium]
MKGFLSFLALVFLIAASLVAALWGPAVAAASGDLSDDSHDPLSGALPEALPEEGEKIEFSLAVDEARVFTATLAADEFLHVEVDQLSADVEVELQQPGLSAWEANLKPWAWGTESVFALPEVTAATRVVVRSTGTRSGDVVLRVVRRRAAGDWERRRYRAEAGFHSTRTERSRHAVSEKLVERALEAAREFSHLGLLLRQSEALSRAATLKIVLGKPLEALPLAEQASSVARAAGGLWEECSARLAYAEAVYARSMVEAVAEEESILDRFDAAEVPPCALKAHRLLVFDLSQQGAHHRVLEHFQLGMVLATSIDASKETADLLLNVGSFHRMQGDTTSALDVLSRARDIYLALGRDWLRLRAEDNLAMVLRDLRDFDGALQIQQGIVARLEKRGELLDLIGAQVSLGDTLRNLGRIEEAQRAYRRAVEVGRQAHEPDRRARAERRLGEIALEQGDLQQARQRLESALETHRQMGNNPGEARALLLLARYKEASGLELRALQGYREVAARAPELGNRDLELEARERAALLLRKRGETAAAAVELNRAIALAEYLRTQAPSDRLRTTSSPLQRRLYDLAIELALDEDSGLSPGSIEKIFLLSERSRARSLRGFLEASRFEARARLDPDLAEREDRLMRQLGELSSELQTMREGGTDSAPRADLRRRIRLAEIQLEVVAAERLERYPRQVGFLEPTLPTLKKIRQVIGDRALLSYHLLEGRSLLFLVTAETLSLIHLPSREEIVPQVAALRRSLERPSRFLGGFSAPAHQLWRDLLEPVASEIAGRSLVISPDGPLHEIPFEALLTAAPRAGEAWGDLKFLLRDHEITYVPSAGVLVTLTSAQALSSKPDSSPEPALIAFGDPSAGGSPKSVDTGSAWNRPRVTQRHSELRTRSGRTDFPSLPFARKEVRALEGVFGPGKARIWVGPEATESQARSVATTKAKYLHFATHGFVEPDFTNHSALVLAPDAQQDGLLRLREVLGLRLSADLVTLSACDTAVGREYPGEGVVSLARAFLYAGASSLIASLWDIADRATVELMANLYRSLLEGQPKAKALRSAKLSLLTTQRTAHPYYWAPFLLSGLPN